MRNRLTGILVVLVLAGCATVAVYNVNELYGPANVRDRVATGTAGAVDYHRDVEPILNRRCLACHGCYDAPCQLKMESPAGLDRGASKDLVYHSSRLQEAPLTRLGIDAQTTAQWREKGFTPVLNERNQTAEINLQGSVLYRMLVLKQQNPLPTNGKLPDAMFDLSPDRDQSCSTLEEFPEYARKYPQGGMPFAMPAISSTDFETLSSWLASGAKVRPEAPLAKPYEAAVAQWEAFFNGPSLKIQLSARYMYEHLFLADIYFDEIGTDEHFKLVRSSTPPGEPIQLIASRRPYDDPGVARPWYRLQRNTDTPVSKTHMAYRLNPARMQRWTSLFLEPDYTVTALPGYDIKQASNPFETYLALPATSRYQFMLDEAQYTIMGFIKGPVCRGQIALDVIEDQFWVWFIDPAIEAATNDAAFLADNVRALALPGQQGSNLVNLASWLEYSKLEHEYLAAKAAHQLATYPNGRELNTDIIWDGDGDNLNATLTIFRHFNSATVVQGLVGAAPKTAWVIDYPLLERIHYLLVAGYDVYGDAGHQVFSRMYMDYLRIGGEMNFLYLMPRGTRQAEIDYWYRGADEKIGEFLADYQTTFAQVSGIEYSGANPKLHLYELLRQRVGSAVSRKYELGASELDPELLGQLSTLASVDGLPVSLLPEMSLLSLQTESGMQTFTLVHNDGHTNVASLVGEDKRRVPAEDTLTVVPGYLGAYPNAFFKLSPGQLPGFVAAVAALASEADYSALMDKYGVRRNDPDFWAHSDRVYDQVEQLDWTERGVLDYSRVENR